MLSTFMSGNLDKPVPLFTSSSLSLNIVLFYFNHTLNTSLIVYHVEAVLMLLVILIRLVLDPTSRNTRQSVKLQWKLLPSRVAQERLGSRYLQDLLDLGEFKIRINSALQLLIR